MRIHPGAVTVLLLVALSIPCPAATGEPSPSDEEVAAAVERAEAAVKALGRGLLERLVAEMREGGPAHALRVCSEVAPTLASAQSTDGMTVRRVSLKARNPADAPDDHERAVLLRWERSRADGVEPTRDVQVSADGRRVRVMSPIKVASTCLQCHGPVDEMDPDVAASLAELYPGDPATGYAVGDLRGAFSVKMELDRLPSGSRP